MNGPKRRLASFDAPPPRRLNTLGSGYTWFVRIAKFLLPLAAIVIIGIVAARLSLDPDREKITDLPQDSKTSAGQIQLEKAKYEGVDSQGRPYTLTAEAASRSPATPDRVDLTTPKADITMQDGQWIALEAGTGSFDTGTGQLLLNGGVRIFHDSGNEMTLDSIDIDTKKGSAVSHSRINAQGPLGTLSATGVTVDTSGDIIIFGGPATMTLRLPKKNVKG